MYSIPPLITSLFFIAIGLFVFFNNSKSKTNLSFFLLCLTTFGWQVSWFGLFSKIYSSGSDLLIKVGYSFIIFIPITYYQFLVKFLRVKQSSTLKFAYLFGFACLIALWTTPFLVNGSYDFFWGSYPRAGILHPIYLIFLAGLSAKGIIMLVRSGADPKFQDRRNQIRYVLIALLFYIPAASDFLVNYGTEIYPFGFIFIALSLLTIAIAIARHQLMDIEVIVRRTAVFTGLFAFVYAAFTVITIMGQEFFRVTLGWNQWMAMIPTVTIITLTLRPLEIFLSNITEKFLFQKAYDYRQLLRTFSTEILTILDLQKLLDQTVIQLSKIMKLEYACVLLNQKDEKCFTIVASTGLKEKDVVYNDDDILIKLLREGHHPIQKDKASDQVEGDGRLRNDFKRINAQLCLPIMLHDELIGILALSMKKSGDDYTPEDVDILSTLARTEAIAISNAQLFDELSKTQAEAAQREKMAVIGTLAAGINHEICNPLGIVRGQCEMFLLNMRDGLYKDKTPEQMTQISSDIMTKVIKETDRATGITKKLSSFAKPSRKNESEDVSVQREVDEIIGLLGHDLRLSNIEFKYDLPEDFPSIHVDRKQFQEVLFNIIRNAAQAMDKKNGFIAIGGFLEHGFPVIKISDNGMGIPKDKINQIFNPFYTTKAPGKGTGLGLFIVKQVVERNKGTIEVDSTEGEGTTFILRFPAAERLAAA